MSKRGKTRAAANGLRPYAYLKALSDRKAVLAFLVFLVIVLFLFDAVIDQQALYAGQASGGTELTRELADKVTSKLVIDSREKDGIAFIVKDTVDPELLEYFTSMDYHDIKAHMGISSEFMIHFEDQDGRVVPMGSKMCVGSKTARINGVPCS